LFVDSYFDDVKQKLLKQDIGVRHRLRYSQDVLINELVQIKLPTSADGVIRQEIKYEVPNKSNLLDQISRHPILQFVRTADRDQFSFELRKWDVDVTDIRKELTLTQKRKRYYINDKLGSVATISFDHVRNKKMPFQEFFELEIEINEIRYTEASRDEKAYLEYITGTVKEKIMSQFPHLRIDQTPKYNKLSTLIDVSYASKFADYGMWLFYGLILCMAVVKLIQT